MRVTRNFLNLRPCRLTNSVILLYLQSFSQILSYFIFSSNQFNWNYCSFNVQVLNINNWQDIGLQKVSAFVHMLSFIYRCKLYTCYMCTCVSVESCELAALTPSFVNYNYIPIQVAPSFNPFKDPGCETWRPDIDIIDRVSLFRRSVTLSRIAAT